MRLINADLLIDELEKKIRTPRSTMEIVRDIIPMVKRQPTAFDVDKLIENIKKSYSAKTYKGFDTPIYLIPVDKVIEIIKGSGNDDT
jgi:nitrogen regulatory protein PII